jgi:glycosyltransferase involved in cell wall biosynthesis
MTPRIDEEDPLLGFIITWVNKLAEKVEKLYIICTGYGKADLRKNIEVYNLGKKSNKFTKANYFVKLMFSILPKVDVVFCHMYPEFTLMAAPFAKIFRKPIVTWYAHRHVNWKLLIAHSLASRMITASKEGLRIRSSKVIVTGHGIDTERFKPVINLDIKEKDRIIILSVGRISPIKDYETLIKAAGLLVNEEDMRNLKFIIVGGVPMKSHVKYYEKLREMVSELELENYVKFMGFVPFKNITDYYYQSDIFVNLCPTGSADKAVLEAMACGKPVIVCNETYRSLLRPYDNICMFKYRDFKDLAIKLKELITNKSLWAEIGKHNREQVIKYHSLTHFLDLLIRIFKEVSA